MSAALQIFFKGQYSYRRFHSLVGGLIALGFGLFALRYIILGMVHTPWTWKMVPSILFVGGIGSLLAFCGLVLLKRWFARTVICLEISADGIRYGKHFYPWEDVDWIAGHAQGKRIQLFLQKRGHGVARFDRHLLIDQGITPDEYSCLIDTLQRHIGPIYPNLTIG